MPGHIGAAGIGEVFGAADAGIVSRGGVVSILML